MKRKQMNIARKAIGVFMKEIQQFIEYDELINYLPHKGKMFLLSRVTQHDVNNHTITSEYDITENCIFYEKE